MNPLNTRILIADDVFVVRELHKTMLREFGFTNFIDAKDGQDAIDLSSAHEFSMALLDIDMPKFSGLDVLKSIRKINHKIFVIIVSGAGTTENVSTALDLGVDGFLVKPYSRRKLEDVVNKFLSRYLE